MTSVEVSPVVTWSVFTMPLIVCHRVWKEVFAWSVVRVGALGFPWTLWYMVNVRVTEGTVGSFCPVLSVGNCHSWYERPETFFQTVFCIQSCSNMSKNLVKYVSPFCFSELVRSIISWSDGKVDKRCETFFFFSLSPVDRWVSRFPVSDLWGG